MNIEFVGYKLDRNVYKLTCPHCREEFRVGFKPGSVKMFNHGCGSQIIYTQRGTCLTQSLVQEVGRS